MKNISKILKLMNTKQKINAFYLSAMTIFVSATEVLCIYYLYQLIKILNSEKVKYFFLNYDYISILKFFGLNPNSKVVFLIFFVFILYLFKSIFLLYFNYFQYKYINNFRTDLSSKLLNYYLSLDYIESIRENSSIKVRNLETEVLQFTSGVIQPLIIFISELVIFFGIVIYLHFQIQSFALAASFAFLSLGACYFFFIKKYLTFFGKQRQFFSHQILKYVIESIQGFKTLLIYNTKDFFLKITNKNLKQIENINIKIGVITQIPKIVIEFLVVVLTLVVILINFSPESILGNTTIMSKIALFVLASFKLLPSINKIIFSSQILKYNLPSLNVLDSSLNLKRDTERINGKEQISRSQKIHNNQEEIVTFKNSIEFVNVNYKYPGSDKYIFKNLNLEIKKNTTVGIVGSTGVGKSTFLDLLMGLLLPTEGKILIDEKNLPDLKKNWINFFSYVPQKVFISDDTIESNIAFGVEKKLIDQKKLNLAIQKSALTNFIAGLPMREKNLVGEGGSFLSGGQSQRLGIARAFYKDAEIFIFDESTNSVDDATEKLIFENIIMETKSKTVFVVTHKKDNLIICDTIYELKNSNLFKIK